MTLDAGPDPAVHPVVVVADDAAGVVALWADDGGDAAVAAVAEDVAAIEQVCRPDPPVRRRPDFIERFAAGPAAIALDESSYPSDAAESPTCVRFLGWTADSLGIPGNRK